MRSGRVPSLGEQVADGYMGYFAPPCRRFIKRQTIPAVVVVTSPSGDQTRLAAQPEKPPQDTPEANKPAPAEDEKPPKKEEAPEASANAPEKKKAPKPEATQASSSSSSPEPVRTGTVRAVLNFGRHFVSSRRTNSRWARNLIMG